MAWRDGSAWWWCGCGALVVLVAFFSLWAMGADVQIRTELDRQKVEIGESFQLQVSIDASGSVDVGPPEFPRVENFLLLDTDVLIDFLRGHPEAIQLLETSDHEFWISAVSVAELYVRVQDGKEREVLDQLIGLLRVVEITTEIAQQAGL